jgi:hypothetical protein
MDTKPKDDTNLTKFPNAEKANSEAPINLPSAFSLFTPSVNLIKNNLTTFLILLGVPLVLTLIGQGPALWEGAKPDEGLLSGFDGPLAIFALIGGILGLLASPGVVILQLRGARNEAPIGWQEAFKQGLNYFWRFLGLALLSAVILAGATLLFIIPVFFVLPRIFLAMYYLIDRNMGIVESLKMSSADYKAHKGIWGVIGVFFLIGLVNIIPLVGWLVSNVLSFLYSPAVAIRYEQIKRISTGKSPRTPIEEISAAAPAATPTA